MHLTLATETVVNCPTSNHVRRLGTRDTFECLDPETLSALAGRVECIGAGCDLVTPGETTRTVRVLLQGWAARYQSLEDGRRQIISFMFAGDAASFWTPAAGLADQGVRTLTPCRLLVIEGRRLAEVARTNPIVAERMRLAASANVANLNAWLVNLGLRKAPERTAHLLCELWRRLSLAGWSVGNADCLLPLTQQDLADALGMTSVHVNRVLQRLRAMGLIDLRKGALILRDRAGLAGMCAFDGGYLNPAHIECPGAST